MQTSEAPPVPQSMDEKKKELRTSLLFKLRPIYPFIVILAIWQVAAMQARGNQGRLFPTVDAIVYRAWELVTDPLFRALAENPNLSFLDHIWKLLESPILLHTLNTAWRLPFSFFIAAVVGTIVGIMMGRFAFWESFFVPLLSVLLPIPAIAWTPIVVIWSGIGDQTVIVITAFASFLPIAMAVWTGVKTVNPVWIRAAQSMNADKMTIFRTVVLPGSLPMILSGMRIGLARAWRAGVGAEAFAGIRWGLSAGIFDAQEYLDIAFMMVALGILGLFGFVLEKVLFQPIESRTVIRWGMMEAMGAQDKKV
ncbi:MAG: ABC transporter permease [Nitrospinae bacterium]|nr:ABC transporter permease [Nitrospinota bacterium]